MGIDLSGKLRHVDGTLTAPISRHRGGRRFLAHHRENVCVPVPRRSRPSRESFHIACDGLEQGGRRKGPVHASRYRAPAQEKQLIHEVMCLVGQLEFHSFEMNVDTGRSVSYLSVDTNARAFVW